MKKLLFIVLFASLVLMLVSLLTLNIYLLGIAEILIIPAIVLLVRINLSARIK